MAHRKIGRSVAAKKTATARNKRSRRRTVVRTTPQTRRRNLKRSI